MHSVSNSDLAYIEEQLLNLKRTAIRGKSLPWTGANSRKIDTFQHIEDEVDRTLAVVGKYRNPR